MPESTASTKKYAAPALEKGLDILELLSSEEAGLGQTEIARRLGRSVSEIFRMLVVLQERGYVALDPLTDRYGLTTLLFEIGHRTPRIKRLTTLAAPIMQRTAREVNQSVHLAVLAEDSVLIVGQVDSPGNNVMTVRLGARIGLWQATSGRVLMAHQPENILADKLKQVPLPAGASEEALRKEFSEMQKKGFEIRDSYVVRGIVNIAAPIFDHSGMAVAALTIPHLERYHDAISFDTCVAAVIRAAAAITRGLGGAVAHDAILSPD